MSNRKIRTICLSEEADNAINQLKAFKDFNFSAYVDEQIKKDFLRRPEKSIELLQNEIKQIEKQLEEHIRKKGILRGLGDD